MYEARPSTCKGYSCATDARIWKDFEKMELNTEWLSENLSGADRPRAVAAVMYQPADARSKT